MDETGGLPPLQRLLVAHAQAADRDWNEIAWTLDQRLAAVVRGANEPMIALIRMAWWEEALVAGDLSKGKGEPLVEAWRAHASSAVRGQWAAHLIEGWRALVEADEGAPVDLERYAAGRGVGLFGLIGGEVAAQGKAGAIWALWDLASHVRDPALAQRAITLGGEFAGEEGKPARDMARPLRLAVSVAMPDVRAGRIPPSFSPRHYLRLLRGSLFA